MNAIATKSANPELQAQVLTKIDALPDEMFSSVRPIEEIIIHCSATKEGQNFSATDIRRWHRERGFADIGYHFVVRNDGTVEQGRSINKIGAHCLNHNRLSVGICYIGGLDSLKRPKDTRTEAQRIALPAIIRRIRRHHPRSAVYGHRDFAAKACPCFDARHEYNSLS